VEVEEEEQHHQVEEAEQVVTEHLSLEEHKFH
jgi:hypothetical protein